MLAPTKLDADQVSPDQQNDQRMLEVLLPPGSGLAGDCLRDLRFRQRYNVTVLAMRRGNDVVRERLGRIQLREGDVLLLQGPKDAIRGLQESIDLLVLETLEQDLPPSNRKQIALLIAVLVIVLPAFKLIPLVASVLLGLVAMVATGCIRTGEMLRSVRLDVILLIGSLDCFSVALKETGVAEMMAQGLLQGLHGWPIYAALLAVFLISTLLTEVMSNAATVALLIPVAGELALGLDQPPRAFVYAVLFGASQCFLSPVGYHTNTMVYGPGRYRFLDVTRYGLPFTLVMTIAVPFLICRMFGI